MDIRYVNVSAISVIRGFDQGRKRHVLFALTLLVILSLFTFSSRYYLELIPRALFIYFFILSNTYTGRWLGKTGLLRQRWVLATLAGGTSFVGLSLIGILGWIYLTNQDSRSFLITIPLFTLLFILVGAGVTITRTVFRQQLHEARIRQTQRESELNLLISQLSPHFLFNTLNNIYGLAIQGDRQVPAHIVKLSDLLRYSVYLARQSLISLKEEVAYLKNYADFETIRFGERLQLTMALDDIDAGLTVAPMLFIPFVENAFKHTKNAQGQPEQIYIQLRTEGTSIFLVVKNSHHWLSDSKELETTGGMGLENVRRRLALLYPGTHDLIIETQKDYFSIKLTITATEE